MIDFKLMEKNNFSDTAMNLFLILNDNMLKIIRNNNGRGFAENYPIWREAVENKLKNEENNIVLMYAKNEIIGFFQYSTNQEGNFMMEEIQILPEYQGKAYNVFRNLFGYLFSILPSNLKTVEAYTNKKNRKAQKILIHLGLHRTGKNNSGDSYRYQGFYENLKKWHDLKVEAYTR